MKRSLSLLLSIVMILSMIPIIGITASAAGEVAEPNLTKDEDGAYLINSVEDWKIFAAYTHDGANVDIVSGKEGYVCGGMSFKLTADLDFTGVDTVHDNIMIGRYYTAGGSNYRYYFAGSFDGQGHTVSNITMSLGRNAGLFAGAAGATIKNLNIANSSFKVTKFNFYAGALIANVVGSDAYKTTTIENCKIDNVSLDGCRVGGFVGQVNGDAKNFNNCELIIRDCSANVNITSDLTGTANNTAGAGAIIGMLSNGAVDNGRNTTVLVTDCIANGSITVKADSNDSVNMGGIAGAIGADKADTTDAVAVFNNCYSDVALELKGSTVKSDGYAGVGGLFGTATMFASAAPVSIVNCYTTANITVDDAIKASTNAGAVIGNASMDQTKIDVDCDYLNTKELNAIGKGGNTLCNTEKATITQAVLVIPNVEGTLVLDEKDIGIRYYISNVSDGTKFYLNGQAVELDDNGAITDVVDIKECTRISTLTVLAKVNDTTCKKVIFYGVEKYAELQKDDAEAKAVAEALMNYGKYMNAYVSGVTLEDINVEMNAESTPASADPEGLTYNGSSLLVDSAVTLRHYYMLDEGKAISDYALTVNGNELTWCEKTITFGAESLTLYYVEFEVAATDLGTQFDVKLGDTVILRYSVMDYCMRAAENDKATAPVINAVKALYNYRWAANDYFLSRQTEA